MKIKYNWFVSFCIMLYFSFCLLSIPTFASATGCATFPKLANYYEGKGEWSVKDYKNVVFATYPTWYNPDGESYKIIYSNSDIALNAGTNYVTYNYNTVLSKDGVVTSSDGVIHPLSSGNLEIPFTAMYVIKGSATYQGVNIETGTSEQTGISTDFNSSDITEYPVGTVRIVQPKSGSKFDSGVTTTIDIEVWGKIPITINDSAWFGLGEETWLKNALSAPITNNSAIYINGVKDMIGTGIGINSASLGDSYGLEILGDLEDWKQAGYYCFKYKFTYSPLDKNSINEITYGVSPVTSWKVNTFIDDYTYTYYKDTLDLKVSNYVDYNNDGIDDLTGEDLSDLNDNSSSIGLDENASIAEIMEYYTNKFYDAITGVIKTPFNMLESALKLGDTYLIKLTNLLEPVTQNFKQLLSFIPDDIMTCIWAIISCRLIWTAIRSFIAMLTKR